MRETVEPSIEHRNDVTTDFVLKHPAYGQIGVSRISGDRYLYGSEYGHRNFMIVRIHTSELHRGLSQDRHFARTEIIEVALSEAQWATFVSSPNVGMGTCCTIERLNGTLVPAIPSPRNKTRDFSDELKKQFSGVIDRLVALKARIKKKISQADDHELDIAISHLKANPQFVADQFGEYMESRVEDAKVEVHAYMTSTLQRAGLAALSKNAPIALPEDTHAK